jgi:hypothetical protein
MTIDSLSRCRCHFVIEFSPQDACARLFDFNTTKLFVWITRDAVGMDARPCHAGFPWKTLETAAVTWTMGH